MIEINGKQLRNLEEQVLKNKEDIARHYQATNLPANLAGITVVGTVDDASELPDKDTYSGSYGDAYVQKVDDDTILWIWTRANPDAGELTDYWLDVPFTTVGPQGPQGERGERGEQGVRGSQWFSGTGVPSNTSGYNVGDYYINVGTGNIWHLHMVNTTPTWLLEGNIIGPQGPQGIQGPKGDKGETGTQGPQGIAGPAGPIVDLLGVITSVDQLPDPSTVSSQSGYLQMIDSQYRVWIIVGGQWFDAGILNGGSIVTSNGTIQSEWNADTKLNKNTDSGAYRLYGVNASGNEWHPVLRQIPQTTNSAYKYQPVMYDVTDNKSVNNGLIRVSETPLENYHTASKYYVDNRYRLYRHDINFVVNDSGDSYTCYFTLYNTQQTAMNSSNLHTDNTISISGVVDRTDGSQYPICYGSINPGTSDVTLYYYSHEEKQMVSVSLDSASFNTYDHITRVF